MEGNIAATYALIYRFLKRQAQDRAAVAVKKAAKPFVVLRDDIAPKGPPLEDIIKEWNTKASTKTGDTDSSSEDSGSDDSSSDSEDSSSSDSSSEESGDTSGSGSEGDDISGGDGSGGGSDEGTIPKQLSQKRDTSVTLSSAGEYAQEVANQVVQVPKKSAGKATKGKNKSPKSGSSGSESSDSDSSLESSTSESSDAESSSSSSGTPTSSDSSDENEENANEQLPPNRMKTAKATSQSTSESDSQSQLKEDTRVAKKRKISENEAVVTTAVATGSQQIARALQKKEKLPPKAKERFQRVKIQNLAPDLLLDNGYEARGGAVNDYGGRAHRDLVVTRGTGFRKEKNKKKRGSYRGGEITMENHSIKFDF